MKHPEGRGYPPKRRSRPAISWPLLLIFCFSCRESFIIFMKNLAPALIFLLDKVNLAILQENFFSMVADLKFRGSVGKRGLMFVPYYGMSRAFIANYSSWREYCQEGKIAEVAASLLSHETLHIAINRFSLAASANLDNLFGRSNSWELYYHGLGDFDRIHRNSFGKCAKRRR